MDKEIAQVLRYRSFGGLVFSLVTNTHRKKLIRTIFKIINNDVKKQSIAKIAVSSLYSRTKYIMYENEDAIRMLKLESYL